MAVAATSVHPLLTTSAGDDSVEPAMVRESRITAPGAAARAH
ncbi:hypothetical protein [Leifsonia sp. A12D58]